MEQREIRNRIVEKMLRKRVVGAKNRTVDSVVNVALPSHAQGEGKQLIREMLADPDGPIERYGGQRNAIRLRSVEAAVAYLEGHGGNVPFGF